MTRQQALKAANGCPGCANHPHLPTVHLCTPPIPFGSRLRIITHEQSRVATSILPLQTSSTIPWIQGEILLMTVAKAA